jgi:phage protein D
MQTAKYRIYLDGKALAKSALDRVDVVTVQQEMDRAWQARLDLLVCTTERGKWEGEDDSLLQPFKRVRIEVAVDAGQTWVPLIDGPVVGYDSALSPEPSQSTITVRISDDSIRLWRHDESTRWSGNTDSDIARNIFTQSNAVSDTRIDKTEAGTSDRPAAIMQRGTPLETLHELASRHALFHAWVAPGDQAGQSVGMFKMEETRVGSLPSLVLLGNGRNLDSFQGNDDQQRPADVTGWSLDLSDLSSSSGSSSYSDQLAGNDDPAIEDSNVAKLVVPPRYAYGVGPDELAARFAASYGEAFDASGIVRSRCYAGVLQPYKMVEVKGVNGRLSGNYVIRSVTHTLTRSEYTQSFSLLRRGQSGGADASNPNSPTENVA